MTQLSTEHTHEKLTGSEVRDLLRQAVPFALEARSLPPVSPKTRACYVSACARLLKGQPLGSVPELPASNKNSWSLHRSALARTSREALLSAVEAAAHRVEGVDVGLLVRTWLPLAQAFSFAPVGDARKAREGERRSAASKKKAAAALPAGWLDELWTLAQSRRDGKPSRCADALAIAVLTGCRPAELESGVVVALDGGTLSLGIRGAKVTEAHGQPWRVVRVPVATPPAVHLAALAAGGQVTISYGADAFSDRVAAIAGTRWGRRISGYDIRHARAADATVTLDADERARLLGHVRRETGGYYGRGKKGRGLALKDGEVAEVRAPRPVSGRDYSSRPSSKVAVTGPEMR